MKFYLVAVVAVLFCAVVVYAEYSSDKEITDLRKSMDCVDGVFVELVGKHKEMEKSYSDYQALTKETNLQLADCEKVQNLDFKKECVTNAIMMYSMLHLSEIIENLEVENKDLSEKLMNLIVQKCD